MCPITITKHCTGDTGPLNSPLCPQALVFAPRLPCSPQGKPLRIGLAQRLRLGAVAAATPQVRRPQHLLWQYCCALSQHNEA